MDEDAVAGGWLKVTTKIREKTKRPTDEKPIGQRD